MSASQQTHISLVRPRCSVKKPLTLFSLEELRERKMHDIARILQYRQGTARAAHAREEPRELREKSLGIFHGRKRRRGSWHLYFLGDYIHMPRTL